MRYYLSLVITALCAAGTMFFLVFLVEDDRYGVTVFFLMPVAAIAGVVWARYAFPRMGKSAGQDFLWIVAAYPAVAALALLFVGSPLLVLHAPMVYLLPFMSPTKILPIFVIGAILAANLPEREYRWW